MDLSQLKNILLDQKKSLLDSQGQGITRHISLEQHLEIPEISVLTGVRRCGKSTILKQLAYIKQLEWNIHYINFEDYRLTKFSLDDFESAYNEFLLDADLNKRHLLLYDEIENIRGWEKWVSSFASANRVKIFITGSNATLLNSELATLLTGRHEQIKITPLRYPELLPTELRSLKPLDGITTDQSVIMRRLFYQYQKYGGFPRSYLAESAEILTQYYEDIILKDLAFRRKVRNIVALKDLGSILASQNTRLFNRSKVAHELNIKDTNTLSKFCSYFVDAFLFDELRCFSESRRKQLKSLSKFYAVDPILAKKSGYHHSGSDYWILENFVFLELKRRFSHIWYWNSEKKFEVDFIVKDFDGSLYAFQVAQSIKSIDTKTRELRAIEAAFFELNIRKAFIITENERDTLEVQKRLVEVFPFYRWAQI